MGVALSPCTIPAAGARRSSCPTARWRSAWASTASRASGAAPLETADEIADELIDAILGDLPYRRGDGSAVLVNGLGATPKEELYILYRSVARILDGEGIRVHRVWVGEYATSLEMAGASVSLSASTTSFADSSTRRPKPRSSSRRERAAVDGSGAALEGPSAGFAALVVAVATDLIGHRDELNRLDGVAGDGDLGLTVTTASKALIELAPNLAALPEGEAIRKSGTEIARRAPSTGGTLIAFALMAAAKAPVDPGAPALERAAAYLDAASASIAQRGQVQPGDRTMLDALAPAAEAMRAALARGGDAAVAAREAARAADTGATATSTMAAKVGRAGWLAERAAGHEDAGARLVALAFAASARHVARRL